MGVAVPALLLLVVGFSQAVELFQSPKYSLIGPFSGVENNWVNLGDAVFEKDYARLTSDEQSKFGSIWNPNPFVTAGSVWEVDVQFNIHGAGIDYYGDGFAFWYTKDSGTGGPVLGGADKFTGLGVFFDTYDNTGGKLKHPIVKVMLGDGVKTYNDMWAPDVADKNHGLYCHTHNLRVTSGEGANEINMARIRYENSTLSVKLSLQGKNEWESCLTVENVYLPESYYFGLSSSTGALTDNHDIREVKVKTEGDVSDTEEPTPEEMEGINNIVRDTRVVKLLKEQATKHALKIDQLTAHLEGQVKALGAHMETMVERVRNTEMKLRNRLNELEAQGDQQLKSVKDEAHAHISGWFLPFMLVIGVVLFALGYAFTQYKKLKKQHRF